LTNDVGLILNSLEEKLKHKFNDLQFDEELKNLTPFSTAPCFVSAAA
jgi:hypothetical protein